jgi:hypothetical protein
MEPQKNLEQVQQEYRPQPISEAERFDRAQYQTLVIDADETKIREALRYCMVKIGLRAANFPQGAEKMLLVQHVYQTFPTITTEEIRIAFDWAIEGRTKVDVNCFENFSCRYFSQIINAYLELKRSIPPPKQEVKVIECKEPPLTKDEWDKWLSSPFANRLKKAGVKFSE